MTKTIVVQCVCIRCGDISEFELGLINKNDKAVYKCDNCNFIILVSRIEDLE